MIANSHSPLGLQQCAALRHKGRRLTCHGYCRYSAAFWVWPAAEIILISSRYGEITVRSNVRWCWWVSCLVDRRRRVALISSPHSSGREGGERSQSYEWMRLRVFFHRRVRRRRNYCCRYASHIGVFAAHPELPVSQKQCARFPFSSGLWRVGAMFEHTLFNWFCALGLVRSVEPNSSA